MAARRRLVWLAAVALAIGACSFWYRGPGRPFIRGHVGDVGATMLVYALLGLVGRGGANARAAITAALALAIELGQLARGGVPRGATGELLLGASFDAWDLLAYAIGIGVGWGWERAAHHSPVDGIEAQGSRGGRAAPR